MRFSQVCGSVEAGQPVLVPDEFAAAIRSAAAEARVRHEIGPVQLWRINAATRNQRQLARIYAGTVHEALEAARLDPNADVHGFDWQSLLAFIRELLPLILQIISIFS